MIEICALIQLFIALYFDELIIHFVFIYIIKLMGLKESTPIDKTQYISLDTFYSGRKHHQNIYQSRLSSSSSTRELIHQSISFTESTETIIRYLDMLKSLGKKIECSNLYLPVLCSVKPAQTICSDFQVLELYYQQYKVKVKDQIQARQRYGENFSEQQIWYILYSILNGVRMYEQCKMSSGNLKTSKILLNDKGHLKLINKLTKPQQYQHEKINSKAQLYRFYAPEELRAIRQKIDKKINHNVADTFSIGIILLEFTTFIPGEDFYDLERMILKDNVLKKADGILAKKYSKLLYNLARTMLSSYYDRPLPSQIHSVFRTYQHRILNLKPFSFEENRQLQISNASLLSL